MLNQRKVQDKAKKRCPQKKFFLQQKILRQDAKKWNLSKVKKKETKTKNWENTADLVTVFVVRIGSVPPEIAVLELDWGTTTIFSSSSASSTSIKSSRDSSGDDSDDSCT